MRSFAFPLIALILIVPGQAVADIYKCAGPGGTVQYSQSRTSANCTELNQAPAPPAAGDDSGSLKKYLNQVDEEQAARSKQQADAAKQAEAKQHACSIARSHAAMLSQTGRVFTTDENGNRSYLSDAQYEQQRQQANAAVEQLCE